jgi:hypothetical protein
MPKIWCKFNQNLPLFIGDISIWNFEIICFSNDINENYLSKTTLNPQGDEFFPRFTVKKPLYEEGSTKKPEWLLSADFLTSPLMGGGFSVIWLWLLGKKYPRSRTESLLNWYLKNFNYFFIPDSTVPSFSRLFSQDLGHLYRFKDDCFLAENRLKQGNVSMFFGFSLLDDMGSFAFLSLSVSGFWIRLYVSLKLQWPAEPSLWVSFLLPF